MFSRRGCKDDKGAEFFNMSKINLCASVDSVCLHINMSHADLCFHAEDAKMIRAQSFLTCQK